MAFRKAVPSVGPTAAQRTRKRQWLGGQGHSPVRRAQLVHRGSRGTARQCPAEPLAGQDLQTLGSHRLHACHECGQVIFLFSFFLQY